MKQGLAARRAALAMLRGVLQEGKMLSDLTLPDLAPAERARARRLAEETLRRVEPADTLLKPFLRRAPAAEVRNILRLALVEMALGAAAHGVVDAAVTLTRDGRKTCHMAGLVNAVLRRASADMLATMPVQKLPRWLRQPLVHAYGRDAVAMMEKVQATAPPIDLTPSGRGEMPEGLTLPSGSLRIEPGQQISALPGYEAGNWWVQDAAAAIPARLLSPQPGERVLDLCAAPGGKTMQLAAAGARVTALDISESRMERLRENLARTGLASDLVVADALRWQPEQAFDAILLDAPCSASGTLRRHPDLPFVKDGAGIESLLALQAELTGRALNWLKPGGRLVYAVCSLLPREGEDQLAAILASRADLRVEQVDLAGIDPDWWTDRGGLRLRPDYWAEKGGMDGFFCARMRRVP